MDDLLGEDWKASSKPLPSAQVPHTTSYASTSGGFKTIPQPTTASVSRSSTPLMGGRPSSTVSGGKQKINDQFGNLLSLKLQPQKSDSVLSIQARQEQLLEERRRQQEQHAQLWDTLGSGRGTPELHNSTPSVSKAQEDEEDILAAFRKDVHVDNASHFPPPTNVEGVGNQVSAARQTASVPSVNPPYFEDDDDDPFDLKSLPKPSNQKAFTPGTSLASTDDADDILGDLGKPVDAMPVGHERTAEQSLPVAEKSEVTRGLGAADDRAVAELVEMGFAVDTSRIALTESGGGVQSAVGWLLQQAHEESRQKAQKAKDETRVRRPSPQEVSRSPQRRQGLQDTMPAWMRQESRSHSRPRRNNMELPTNEEKDPASVTSEIGSKLFKSANSLWKASQKQMARTVAEFQHERNTTQPRWLQGDSSDSSRSHSQRRPEGRTIVAQQTAGQSLVVTDEAALLDMPREERPPNNARAFASERYMESPARGRSPVEPLPNRGSSQPIHLQQVAQQDKRTIAKLTRQDVEEQSAQAYVSPARRKKAIPKPAPTLEPEVDLFSPATVQPNSATTPSTKHSTTTQAPPVPRTIPVSQKPKAPQRAIPAVPPTALSTSAKHRKAGAEAFKRGDFAAAHDCYTAALNPLPETHPIMIVIFSNRSLTALKTGDAKTAVSDADRALDIIGVGQGIDESIDLGPDGGLKDMRDFYAKAIMRKAEALEHMEKWMDAALVWRQAIAAGIGGSISLRGRDRCEKAAAPKGAGSAPMKSAVPARPPPARQLVSRVQQSSSDSASSATAVKALRAANAAAEKADDERFALTDQVDARLTAWKGGKADNLRALLQSLDGVLWAEAGWKKVGMSDLVMPNKVKIIYMKAIAKVHPDKIPQNATTEQRMISAAVQSVQVNVSKVSNSSTYYLVPCGPEYHRFLKRASDHNRQRLPPICIREVDMAVWLHRAKSIPCLAKMQSRMTWDEAHPVTVTTAYQKWTLKAMLPWDVSGERSRTMRKIVFPTTRSSLLDYFEHSHPTTTTASINITTGQPHLFHFRTNIPTAASRSASPEPTSSSATPTDTPSSPASNNVCFHHHPHRSRRTRGLGSSHHETQQQVPRRLYQCECRRCRPPCHLRAISGGDQQADFTGQQHTSIGIVPRSRCRHTRGPEQSGVPRIQRSGWRRAGLVPVHKDKIGKAVHQSVRLQQNYEALWPGKGRAWPHLNDCMVTRRGVWPNIIMAFPFSKITLLFSELEDITCHDPPLLPKVRTAETKVKLASWFSSNRAAIHRLGVRDSSALLWALLPERSIDRVYGIQTKSLCRILCRALGLSAVGARDLEAYTIPGRGDLGSCLERVVKARGPPASPRVTLEDVDAMLESLAGFSVFSGPTVPKTPSPSSNRASVLRDVLLRATALESKWIVRLILKDVSPVLMDDHAVLRSFHFLLPDLLRFQNNIVRALTLLKGELSEFPPQPDVRSESLHRQQAATLIKPSIGVKIGRPQFHKARSPKQCFEMVDRQKWVLERKYDGEYCELHIRVDRSTDPKTWITIFSKGGKDSTADRKALHATLVKCLRLGQQNCKIKRKAILLGELVVCKGNDNAPLPFEKIRQHVTRSGRSLGTKADSQADLDEHLAVSFFDLLLWDDEIVLQRSVEERRNLLRELYQKIPGRVFGAEWRIVDFAEPGAEDQLLIQFAASIAQRCEGLVLKPCGVPYVNLGQCVKSHLDGYIKLKKDYMEGLGDEADFAIVGASYNAQRAVKHSLPGLQWTDFHLGCLLNKNDVQRYETVRPRFMIVDTISHNACIPMPILQSMNTVGQYSTSKNIDGEQPAAFDVKIGAGCRIDAIFDTPMIVEVLGSGFVKLPNCEFFMLRHARMRKLHEDRSWKSTVSFQELQEQARISRTPPEDSESQETRRRVTELKRRCVRKLERQRAVTPSSVRVSSTLRSSSASLPSEPENLRSAAAMQAKVLQLSHQQHMLKPSRHGNLRLAENPMAHSKRSLEDYDVLQDFSIKRLKANSGTLEKRFRAKACLSDASSPLADITNVARNDQRRTEAELSPISASSATTDLSRTPLRNSPDSGSSIRTDTPPSSPPCPYAEIATCDSSSCMFSRTVIYIAPCISSNSHIAQTLLAKHNALIVPSISHWDRDSFAHKPLTAIISESQAYADMRKVVLVERNEEQSFKHVTKEIMALNQGAFREQVEVWDWRVLEEPSCARHSLERPNAIKHLLGATVFDEGRQRASLVATF
nr:uba domain-containing protein 7 [Quercus suber]